MRLLPQASQFFDELERHAAWIVESTDSLLAAVNGKANLADTAREIKQAETECDEITHRVVLELHNTMIAPVERLDTHDLITRLDDVMDAIEQSAFYLARNQQGDVPAAVRELVSSSNEAAVKLAQGIGLLRDLKSGERVLSVCGQLRGREQEAELVSREAVTRLFAEARDAGVLLKWKEAYEALARISNACRAVADVLENIVLDDA